MLVLICFNQIRNKKLFSSLFNHNVCSCNCLAIVPVMLYDPKVAHEFARRMLEKGVYVVAFSYPVVPKGKARIRTQLSAALSEQDILYIVESFKQVKEEMGI